MISYLASLESLWGPFRLLQSHSVLIILGLYLGFILSYALIPVLSRHLPIDRGKEFAVDENAARGKPTGAGLIFVSIFAGVVLVCVPYDLEVYVAVALTLLTMLWGYLDDRSPRPWNEYLKGCLDLAVALATSALFFYGSSSTIWLPFLSATVELPVYVFVPLSTIIIWMSINITNCSDGVDGLSGALVLLALLTLGLIMYIALGHTEVASYLLLPHLQNGPRWGIATFSLVGCLIAYLWYNAYPSKVLMGDAGSRALGFFVGVSIVKTGNPFIILLIGTVLLVNGGTGLVKVAFLRFLNIRIFHNTRFPLHDHVRATRDWSNTQVLVKFVILQLLISMGLVGIFFKVR